MRNPVGAVMIAAVFFGILGTLTVALEVGRPFGDFAAYGYIAEGMPAQLAHETPPWWPPLAEGRLRYGDLVLTINGRPFNAYAWEEMANAYERGDLIQLGVERPGVAQPLLVAVPVTRFTWGDFLDIKLPEIVVGVVFWFLALVVLRSRPDAMTNRVFAAAAACVAIHRLTAVSSLITDDRLLVNLPKTGHMIAAGLIGPLLIYLALLFPKPLARMPRALLFAVFGLGLASGLTLAISRLPLWASVPAPLNAVIDLAAFQTMLVLFLAGVLALLARLLLSVVGWRKAPKRERRVVRIVLFGLFLSMPAVLVVLAPLVPNFGVHRAAFWDWLDLRYFMLAIPIAFALTIVRYRAFQSPPPLFIFLIVFSLSAVLAAVAVWLWALIQPEDHLVGHRPPFGLFFLFIFAASFFWSKQADWRGWFGRVFYRTEQNFRAARRFGEQVIGETDFRRLHATMARGLAAEFALEGAGIWLRQADGEAYELVAAAGEPELPLARQLELAVQWRPEGRPFNVHNPPHPGWLVAPERLGSIEVVVPLVVENRLIGLLGLGRRWDEEIFDERDLSVVELVGQQAALFVLAAGQVEQLRRVPELISEAQERERYRLASDLHDTVQQFLGRLPFFLAIARDSIARDPKRAADLLDRSIGEVGDAADELRQIRSNLAPNRLEISLVKSLSSLTAQVQEQHGLAVHLLAPQGLDAATTVKTRLALYRVIQQALDNTVAHAHATEVSVTLGRTNGRVRFEVADNGRGSTEVARRQSVMDGSFGLQSMQARLESVGGEFVFNSADGQGTVVAGWVPAAGDSPT